MRPAHLQMRVPSQRGVMPGRAAASRRTGPSGTATRLVILTGAGLSAESGLGTFRDEGGLWSSHDLGALATPEGFARDPARVCDFYDARRANAAAAEPNAAHFALARLQAARGRDVTIVTQNVDDLHERAGGAAIHMHGSLFGALCAVCGHRWPAPRLLRPTAQCPACRAPAARPDVVWFGEMPYQIERIEAALARATLFVAIGTSGEVWPAAGFVELAGWAGAACLEINLAPSGRAGAFGGHRTGPASREVPRWVDEVLKG